MIGEKADLVDLRNMIHAIEVGLIRSGKLRWKGKLVPTDLYLKRARNKLKRLHVNMTAMELNHGIRSCL